jgi:hypothetical protein
VGRLVSKTDLRGKILVISVILVIILANSVVIKPQEIDGGKQASQIIELMLEEHRAKAQPSSDIFVKTGTTGCDEGFNELLDLMAKQGFPFYKLDVQENTPRQGGFIANNDVIIVKINAQWDERGGTNTDLLQRLLEAIIKHPEGFRGEIVVADNGQGRGSVTRENNNAEACSQSVQQVVDRVSGSYKVSTYLWDDIREKNVGEYSEGDLGDGYVVNPIENPTTGIQVSYPKFTTTFGTYISFKHGVWNPDSKSYGDAGFKVINVPVLKAHYIYGVTACVKHYMGIVSRPLTNAHESVGTGGMGTMMAETRMPTLNILDAIWVNATPGKGPSTSYSDAVRINVIASSTDPVALDYWAAKHLLLQSVRVRGFNDLVSINPDHTAPSTFGQWLHLSMHEIMKAGYQVTIIEDQMNIYIAN